MTKLNLILLINFVYVLIVGILFFTKKKRVTKENVFFTVLLSLTIVFAPLEYLNSVYLAKDATSTSSIVLNNIYDIMICIWSTVFFTYSLYMIDENQKEDNKNTTIFKFVCITIYMIILSVIVCLMPKNMVAGPDIEFPYDKGPMVQLISLMNLLYVIYIDINIFLNKKNNVRKLVPIITYEALFIVSFVLRYFVSSPGYIVFTQIMSMVMVFMSNTVEQVDLKLITELDVAKQETEKATRAKSDFLSSMSHEIRTPLNAVVGLSELISERDDINDEVRGDLNDIRDASQTLLEIVGNILDINKIESGQMEVQNMNYSPEELAKELLKVNKVRIENKPIEMTYEIGDDVPYELVGDKIHIKQIINNLLSNAVKYTDQGFVKLRITANNDGFVCNLNIQVIDSGKGIKETDYGKLFTKFERLDTEVNSTITGSGLGLAITKQLVELLNGSIRVSSTVGKGSMFEVIIPQTISAMINPKEVALEYRIEQIENETYEETKARRKTILIVDDSNLNLRIAVNHLKNYAITVDTALSGKETLEMTRTKKYDLIFLDLKMPIMDGFKTMDELKRRRNFNTPVVAFTAVEEDVEATCLNAGFTDFLIKPFTKEQLLTKITIHLGPIASKDGSDVFYDGTPKVSASAPKKVEAKPVQQPKPVAQVKTIVQPKPVEQVNSVVQPKPVETVKQNDVAAVVASTKPVEVKKTDTSKDIPVIDIPIPVGKDEPIVPEGVTSNPAPVVEKKEEVEKEPEVKQEKNNNIQDAISFE